MKPFAGKKIYLGVAAVLLLAIVAVPSMSSFVKGDTTVKVAGSTTVYPIVQQAAANGGWTINLSGGGSGEGKAEVLAGTCDVGMCSSQITDAPSLAMLDEWCVGKDMINVIVSAQTYSDLSTALGGTPTVSKNQLFALYTKGSAITSFTWAQFLGVTDPGSGVLHTKVVPVARIIGSGTRKQFDTKIGGTDPTWSAEDATESTVLSTYSIDRQGENGNVRDVVAADSVSSQGAHCIGYVGMGFATDSSKTGSFWVKSSDSGPAIQPIVANYSSYLFSRQLYIYTLKKQYRPASAGYNMDAMDFVEYLCSPAGQAACPQAGFISVPRSLTTTACWWDIAGTNKSMDAVDFSFLVSNWNSTGTAGDPGWAAGKADLNNNGKVDVPDFSKLASLWNHCWAY